MKKLFWVEATLITLILVLFSSCSTTNSVKEDQIVKTAIDLAQSYASDGNYEKTIEVYEKALNSVSDYRLWYNLSIAQYENGDVEKALYSVGKCISKDKKNEKYLKTKALYLKSLSRFDEAIDIYRKLSKAKPEDIQLKKDIITMLTDAGKNQLAYSEALALWNGGTKDSFVSDILYRFGGDEWKIVNKVLSESKK